MEGGNIMALRIMNNVNAAFAQRQLSITSNNLSKSLQKLSSGYRINNAADDAAGLAVSEKMRFQINGLEQAGRNVQDGISLVQVAEGGLQETINILQRIRVLAVQASNGTLSNTDRTLIATEVNQLISEIDRMGSTVTFNGVKLLDGSQATITLHVGASAGQTLAMGMSTISSTQLSISTLAVTSSTDAQAALTSLDGALSSVLSMRANLGAYQNRLENTMNFLGVQRENLMAAESRIRDVDFVSEMTQYIKNQILTQASTAMLA
jgi:flagellin